MLSRRKDTWELCLLKFVCEKARVTGTILRLHNTIFLIIITGNIIIVFDKLLHFYLMKTAMPTVNQ